MARITGRRRPLSLPRKWIADVMAASRRIPYVAVDRRMDLTTLVTARARVAEPPSWPAIFIKAYAIAAARLPALRCAYIPFPWPHLYETDQSIATVAVAREYAGEPAVFFAPIRTPDLSSLGQITATLREFKTKPVEQIRPFARLIRYSRYPLPVRRLLWWMGNNLYGRYRARTFGTFGLSTVAAGGINALKIISPLPTCLTYGPFAADNTLDVRLFLDHRIMDGTGAVAAVRELEAALRGPILKELNDLAPATGSGEGAG
ncbi:hypothetical protein [Fimbriiglobus ruber]|uniref:Pyruvate/2-oxoglutarate dehydrogenase complex, dihydrolipoamide acyltransferase (E2) component n=1 Tax=Fimbriiglobus ruber TaxID=1908690 RepID=A0A225DQA9_9BACT|nr:hypothetical protein [Fimbriiglobus ruber]OWK38545.1 Pyruvate/2-oxoglutarate dehydrogenase complex, dihydrolipoamide acyltransferase (E2) component [Fimbriiglobus ruber]